VLFPQLLGKCQGIINKDWARPTLFQICYLCCFVIRDVLLLIVMFYVLFMCKRVLPPGVNPIAVDKYIDTNKTKFFFVEIAELKTSVERE
jgi:hypothetical protein